MVEPAGLDHSVWWAREDSNLRSLRNRFTACPLWPLGYGPGRTLSAVFSPESGVPTEMPSFDVVSEVDFQEVRNAVDQADREVSTRFDFKNTGSTVELSEKTIELATESDQRLKALTQVLEEKLVKRKVSLKLLSYGDVEEASKGTVRQTVNLNVGISDEKAREIGKYIKGLTLKGVQHQVQGDQLRVSGKKRDDLQKVIAELKEKDFGIPLQFINFRD